MLFLLKGVFSNIRDADHLRISDLTVKKRHAGVFCHGGVPVPPVGLT
jgi:hypothetical protein